MLLAAVSWMHAAEPTPRPNIVFILVDDLRWNTLGCQGDHIVQTPHIDALGTQGVRFSEAFVTTSICSVSRATILTGQWMQRHGIDDFSKTLSPTQWQQTYPALLRKQGYRTGFVGKFGVGNPAAIKEREKDFDYWRGAPGQGGKFFIDPKDPTQTHQTARIGSDALTFLADCRAEQPFCLSISFSAVHARDKEPREFTPDLRDEALYQDVTIPMPELATEEDFQRLPAFVKTSEGRIRYGWRFDSPDKAQAILRDYYRLISGVDREVGRIQEALRQMGLDQNTVIVFTSDNGFALGDRGLADKWFMWEEDIRVASIIYDPRQPATHRSRVVRDMVLNVDYAPTLLSLAGIPVPEGMQGRTLLPWLTGQTPADWRRDFYYEHRTLPARIPPCEGIRTAQWKYIRWVQSEPLVEELYDLKTDPLERRNIIANPASADQREALRTRWQQEREAHR